MNKAPGKTGAFAFAVFKTQTVGTGLGTDQ